MQLIQCKRSQSRNLAKKSWKKVEQDLDGLEIKYVIEITSSKPKEEEDDAETPIGNPYKNFEWKILQDSNTFSL